MRVVVNASVGPRVIGSFPSGRGAFMISSTRWFCHVVSAQATTERRQADDQPAAQLIEVIDDRELVVVGNGPNAPHAHAGSRG